jgi:HEPN domain-containing protein
MKRVTREWVRKAEGDYLAALRESRAGAHDLVCFLAQQCLEKYIKGLLQDRGMAFPRTHDLLYLAGLAVPVCPGLTRFLRRLRRVSDYAVKFRYPGGWATGRQGRSAVKMAGEVRRALRGALGL